MLCEPFDHDHVVVTVDQMEGQEVVVMMMMMVAVDAAMSMRRIIIHYHAEDQLARMVLKVTKKRTTIRIYGNKSNNHTAPETLSPMSSEKR